jgi:hypothetical protein
MGKHVAMDTGSRLNARAVRRRFRAQRAMQRQGVTNTAPPLLLGTMVLTCALIMVTVVDPYSGAVASPSFRFTDDSWTGPVQSLRAGSAAVASPRDDVDTVAGVPGLMGVPAAGIPDPASAQAIGYRMVADRGWGVQEFDCLVLLWNRESRWNVFALNPSSGAYGIPQSLPAEKMATAGADWQTNPATQITWGLNYIQARYDTPCAAWAHSEETNWY